mmetsp:Transcript_34241/g.108814  ORF Transcript_34241/g.108814 Transcript_34241/m.108814 type:complete len:478 (-) Transcript_34241:1383-2816(-)
MLQSDHWSHSQSMHFSSQGCVLHMSTSLKESSQGLPPSSAGLRMWRVLVVTPPPHSMEHLLHSDQAASWQFLGGRTPQPPGTASPTPGLHCATSLTDSFTHVLPFPVAHCTTCRWRSETPKHSQVQPDQSVHSESLQSWSGTQLASNWHSSYSSSRPTTGWPQALGCRATSRWRERKPRSHVAEQALHSVHCIHAPSTHCWQLCRLHARASDLSCGSQSLPPCIGDTATTRLRRFTPPPQVSEQAPHSSQSPSLQSARGLRHFLGAASPSVGLQGPVCLRSPSQKRPSPRPCAAMRRERWRRPEQASLQAPQSLQSVKTQCTTGSQGTPWLQLAETREGPVAGSPQALASRRTLRERQVVPPLQLLEQGCQSSQSSQAPSTHLCELHLCVLHASISSLRNGSQGFPPLPGACTMWRSRVLWPPSHSMVQLLQSDHRPHTQSVTLQALASHCFASSRPRLQPSPPSFGSFSSSRLRFC